MTTNKSHAIELCALAYLAGQHAPPASLLAPLSAEGLRNQTILMPSIRGLNPRYRRHCTKVVFTRSEDFATWKRGCDLGKSELFGESGTSCILDGHLGKLRVKDHQEDSSAIEA